jgi:opacity protein-like surface antigen
MKKILTMAVAASVLATPALAANLENPLYLPAQGQVYSKTSAGIMYKKTDATDAMKLKNHDGAEEFPIWRANEDLGYGITDRLAVYGSFGYTQADDIDRKGMHLGRVGMTYRVFDNASPVVWDVYADAHMGGVSKMTGAYTPTGFNYDNYSNGRWGFHAGTKVGRTWGNLTGALFAEVLQTFGNHNNEIDVTKMKAAGAAGVTAMGGQSNAITACSGGNALACQALGFAGMTDEVSVNLKSTTEFNAGLKTMYQFNTRWSVGGGFTYKHHADNGVKSVATAQNNPFSTAVAKAMAAQLADMEDGFDEYIIGASVANQLSDWAQVALYGEYTLDTANRLSQNGSDIKAEVGVRLNVAF